MKNQSRKAALCLALLMGGSLFFFHHSAAYGASNFIIGWEPNTENDIDGYGIYARRGSPGPPYDHYGDVFVDELSDPDAPQVKMVDVGDGTYYIAATAFDKEGNESPYSDELCVNVSEYSVSECPSYRSSGNTVTSGNSGGGGGGGGCLISSAGEHFGFPEAIGFIGIIGLMGLILLIAILPLEREAGKLGSEKDEKVGR